MYEVGGGGAENARMQDRKMTDNEISVGGVENAGLEHNGQR